MAAFSHFFNPRNSHTMPAIAVTATPSVAKTLKPCPEPKSTISGRTPTGFHRKMAHFQIEN
jgi:hypothetical protein